MARRQPGGSPKQFDATTKQLVETDPLSWVRLVGLPGASAQVVEADLATVTAEADRVLRVDGPEPYLAHLEFQTGYDATMGKRLLRYNALLHYRHDLPVESTVVLLRREADGPQLTGTLRYGTAPAGTAALDFRYRIVRVFEQDPNAVLAGGLATLPLAPLCAVSADAVQRVVDGMRARIEREASPAEAGMLWTATYVLMGLRYPRAFSEQMLKEVRQMKDSVTYQAIIAEGEARGETRGRAKEARDLILRLGRKRFGPPAAPAAAALAAIDSVERLEQLAERLLEAESWDELLG